MKDKFKQLPKALQKQIIMRFALAILFSVLFVIILLVHGDTYLYIPFLLFAGFLIANTTLFQYNSLNGNFVSVSGICTHIDATLFRNRIKSITLEYEGDKTKQLTITVKERMKRVKIGDTVTVYLSDKTPVYTCDGEYWINSYYAIEIRKGA